MLANIQSGVMAITHNSGKLTGATDTVDITRSPLLFLIIVAIVTTSIVAFVFLRGL